MYAITLDQAESHFHTVRCTRIVADGRARNGWVTGYCYDCEEGYTWPAEPQEFQRTSQWLAGVDDDWAWGDYECGLTVMSDGRLAMFWSHYDNFDRITGRSFQPAPAAQQYGFRCSGWVYDRQRREATDLVEALIGLARGGAPEWDPF